MPTSGLQGRELAETETVLLWGQIALAAAVPLALVLCQLGLAVGDPVWPPALEMALLGALPISMLIGWQWRRPLYPFGVWVQYQSPDTLTERQRRWLAQMLPLPRRPWWHPHGWLAMVSGWMVYAGFRQLYATAPAVEAVFGLPPYLRLLGVLWAAFWVGIATVLLQGAVAAARLLLLAEEGGASLPAAQVRRAFTFLGQEGGTVLKVLGVPQAIEDAGRAVVELSPSSEAESPVAENLATAVPSADIASMEPEAAEVVVGEELEPPGAGAVPLGAEAAAAPETSLKTSAEVAIEPLATPVFVNVVEDTPSE